jgi:hypothetical protein
MNIFKKKTGLKSRDVQIGGCKSSLTESTPMEFISSVTIHFTSFVKSYEIKLILKLRRVAICTFGKEDIRGFLYQSSWLSVSPFDMLRLENATRILI